ncbi:MAG: N-acetyltransferase family protein [Candidatus Nanohaloarchaea archaeon]
MEIRKAGKEDAELIVDELWRPLAEEMAEYSDYNELKDDIRKQALEYREEKLGDQEYSIFIAETDGEAAGFAAAQVKESNPVFRKGSYVELEELYVKEEFRRQDIARKLVDRVYDFAQERGCKTVELYVNVRNAPARQLYADMEFQEERIKMIKEVEEDEKN